jgi:adenylate kinase family enzyme
MMRVVLFGSPGSGKSTFARALSARTGLPHVERDTLGTLGSPAYGEAVRSMARGERWIFDGATTQADTDLYARADTVIVLAYPRWVVMERVIRRTVRLAVIRLVRRGKFRRPRSWLGRDHAVTSAWSTYHRRGREASALSTRPDLVAARIVRLSSPREAAAWLAAACDQDS